MDVHKKHHITKKTNIFRIPDIYKKLLCSSVINVTDVKHEYE